MSDKNKEEYKGASTTATVLGQSEVDGALGLVAGGAIGVLAGAVMHDDKKHEVMKGLTDQIRNGVRAADIHIPSDVMKAGPMKAVWHRLPRVGKAVAAALGLAFVGGMIGSLMGIYRGSNKAHEARAQFDDMVTRTRTLETKVESLEEQLEHKKSYIKDLEKERSRNHEPAGVQR